MEKEKLFHQNRNESDRTRRFAISSWEKTKGMLEIRTHNNPGQHSLFLGNIDSVKDYYNKTYNDYAEGKRIKKPSNQDLKNRLLSPLFRIVRETVTGEIEKPSKGWAKHIRREKSLRSK